jgi:ABC-type phosphate/phosphonate transport system substrate-binding protein
MIRFLGLIFALSVLPLTAFAAPVRIAVVTAEAKGCDDGLAKRMGGEAFVSHLKKRLDTQITLCGFANTADAVQALAAGKVDLASSDQAAYLPVRSTVRATLTTRLTKSAGRVMAMALVNKTSSRTAPKLLKGARPIFVANGEVAHDAPLAGLRAAGVDPSTLGREIVAGDLKRAASELRSGKGDVLVVDATQYQRLCLGDKPNQKPCDDLKEIWRGRPAVAQALVVRRDMPNDLRYQLISIYIAMHLEAPAAFAFATRGLPGVACFDPTEADALVEIR